MAKEYIEREAALELLKDDDRCGYLDSGDILAIPTADVVEVVRCKDCKYFGTEICALDTYLFDVTEDGFCNYGERRDNDESLRIST